MGLLFESIVDALLARIDTHNTLCKINIRIQPARVASSYPYDSVEKVVLSRWKTLTDKYDVILDDELFEIYRRVFPKEYPNPNPLPAPCAPEILASEVLEKVRSTLWGLM